LREAETSGCRLDVGQDQRLGARAELDVLEQVVRELPEREDIDEVEEQLERADDALGAGRARNGDLHRRDPTLAWTRT
jgi:hypothetical protein